MTQSPPTPQSADAPTPPNRTAQRATPRPRPVRIQQGQPTYQDAGPVYDQTGKPHSANRKD